jgi:single-strand DNA-binding protein
MAGINKAILVGNLGKDPELRYLEGNIAKVRFSLATSEFYKDKNGNRIEQTEWHNIVMWRGLAENAEKLLKKGMQVYIEGKIQTRQWTDKEGNKKNTTEILAESFVILQKREGTDSDTTFKQGSGDLPF